MVAHAAAPVADADKATALAAVREGNRLLDAGKPEKALEKFKEAHRLVGGTKLYFPFAQAYRAMPGHEDEAYRAYETFLDRTPTASAESIATARAEQADVRQKLALITVRSTPAGANVIVDGQPFGETPMVRSAALAVGTHTLRILKDGYASVQDSFTVTAGQSLDKDLTLVKPTASVAPPPTVAALPTQAVQSQPLPTMKTPAPTEASMKENVLPPEPPSTGTPFYGTWWFWTGVGVVVASAVVIGITASSSDVRHDCGGRTCFGGVP